MLLLLLIVFNRYLLYNIDLYIYLGTVIFKAGKINIFFHPLIIDIDYVNIGKSNLS